MLALGSQPVALGAAVSRREKVGRVTRRSHCTIEITSRCEDALAFVGLNGYVSSEQVARAVFPNRDRARRRLRRLFDAGLIAVTYVSSNRPNLLSLTKRGRAVLEARDAALASRVRLAGPIRAQGVGHHLAIVDVRLFASIEGDEAGRPLRRFESGVASLAHELGITDTHVEPDALAVFGDEGRVIAIEVDMGGETHAVLGRKLEKYRPHCESRTLDGLWIVAVGGVRRQQAIADLVQAAGLSGWARVLDHAVLAMAGGSAPRGATPNASRIREQPSGGGSPPSMEDTDAF